MWVALIVLALLIVVPAGLWLQRKPIAADILDRELARRGVQASYRITRIGLRTQRLEDVVIGDPRNPDLTAEWAEVLVTTRWPTPWKGIVVNKIIARGVRLNARLVGGKVRMGQIDKLLPPPTGKPFAFPDFEIDLDRTSIRFATPAGIVGLALRGRGKLSDGFRGRLAASAPRFAPGAGCVATAVRANVGVATDARSPHVTGPVSANSVACAASDIRATRPQIVVDARLPESFDRWQGRARLGLARLEVARGEAEALSGAIRFAGNSDVTIGSLDVLAGRAGFAGHAGRRLRFDGRYRAQPRTGRFALLGDVGLDELALGAVLRNSLVMPLRSAAGTPIAPLGEAAAAAVTRSTRAVDVGGELKLVHGPGGGGARVERLAARSTSGARLAIAGGEGLTYYWPDRLLRIDGEATLAGGGLPAARLAFDQPRPGGLVSGVLRVAPFAAGDARLALAPVRFTSLAGGRTRIDTVMTLDGGFKDGRVEGLTVPVVGQVDRAGSFAFNSACVTARWRTFRAAGLRLGPASVPLCPTGRGLVHRSGGDPVLGGADIREARFAGTLGQTPITMAAARARFVLGSPAFSAKAVAVRLGTSASLSELDLATLEGRFEPGGAGGSFTGARGDIGNVPLLLSGGAGQWQVIDGDVRVSGGLMVADANANPRFFPLRADAARLSLVDNRIAATAILVDPESGTKVSDVTIAHNLRQGAGNAVLDVQGIRFDAGFQPEALTRLTTGVVALVDGVVRGRGDIRWNRTGVTSTGVFSTEGMKLAAAFGPVEGLTTTIRFSDLLGLRTEPGQIAEIAAIRTGIAVFDGRVTYQLLPGMRVRVEGGRWPFAGGTLSLEETILDFSRPTTKRLVFRVDNLDAARFIQQMEFSNISATGKFDGRIPMEFDTAGGRIVGGRLVAGPEGGTLSYIGELTDKQLGAYGKLAFDALKSLRYSKFEIGLDGKLDGEFVADIELDGIALNTPRPGGLVGRALNQLAKIPFEFNIKIKGPFRTLIATARSLEDPSLLIQSALPDALRDLPAGTASPSPTPQPLPIVQPPPIVQPKESEPVQ